MSALSIDFINARAEAIIAARRRPDREPGYSGHWWVTGLGMAGLGLVNGFVWWVLSMIPPAHIFPQLLP